jgi:hypothetical protein
MNRPRPKWTLALVAGALLLTGCGAATTAATAATATSTTEAVAGSVSPGMAPGMVMPDGSVMGAAPGAAKPPALAVMVCGDEVRGDVTKVLSLPAQPATAATWVDQLYTCTYRLPVGPLVLSVKQSADATAAHDYYLAARKRIGSTVDTAGLGTYAYRTPAGVVGLVKDNFTLTVDATGLPVQFGSQGQKRTDLAYEVASVVLGCWTGDE